MAHIRKRNRAGRGGSKTTVYDARYRDPDGIERSQMFTRRADAERFLTNTESAKLRGEWLDPEAGRVGFGDWSARWLRLQVSLKPKTRAGYESILRTHLLPAFGSRRLLTIEPVGVRQFVADLDAAGAAPRTVRNVYRALSSILSAAVDNRMIHRNPAAGVTLPRPAPSEALFLTATQVEELAEAIGPAHAPVVFLAAYGGLRWGEIAALRGGRVDPSGPACASSSRRRRSAARCCSSRRRTTRAER